MLVTLATQVHTQLLKLDQLERQSNEANNLDATYNALAGLRTALSRIVTQYALLEVLLAPEVRTRVRAQFTQIERAVYSSLQEFSAQPRQVQSIRQMTDSLKLVETDLQTNWTVWAKAQINPLMSTYALVKSLPEMRANGPAISQLNSELHLLAQSLPNGEKLHSFNAKLQRYEEVLRGIAGFSPEVRAFLLKVVAGTATIADLNDQVLEWCRQPGRSTTFRINFITPLA